MSIRVPKYRFRKGSGQALVQINRERIYLGVYDSPESHEKYRRLVAEWLSGNAMAESPPAGTASTQGANLVAATTIGEILVADWGFAECYYVKDGEPTKELGCMREALQPLRDLYASTPTSEFGPKSLQAVRQHMVEEGLCRNVVNHRSVYEPPDHKNRWRGKSRAIPIGPKAQEVIREHLRFVGGLRVSAENPLALLSGEKCKNSKKGRSRYRTDWREPKLLVIYVVDEQGRIDLEFTPVIDGTLKGPDAVFRLLEYYLSQLDVAAADRVLFVADGAKWIWKRVASLWRRLGLKEEQCLELVDFYYVMEHLNTLAGLEESWSGQRRKSWVTRQRSRLRSGEVDAFVAEIRQFCGGKRGKAWRRERDYLLRNATAGRLNYGDVRRLGLPIGSGTM